MSIKTSQVLMRCSGFILQDQIILNPDGCCVQRTDEFGKPLTVLHVFSGDLWAGAERVIYSLLRNLKEYQDLKIIALALNEGLLSKALRDAGIETIVLDEDVYTLRAILFRSVRCLRGRGVQLIHAHRYKENLLSFWLGKLLRVRGILSTIHGLPELCDKLPTGRQTKALQKLDHFLLKHAFSKVIVVSQDMHRILTENYGFPPERITVIYNGIDLPVNIARQDREDSTFHIATIGRMVPVKDLSLFLEVAKSVQEEMGQVRFSILGEGPLRASLEAQVDKLGIGHCVRFEPQRNDPFPFLETVDLYMNTSLHEGIPLSVLEAMACRIPVVAPRVGGLPEIISDKSDGILVEGRLPQAYAEWCVRLAHDSDLRIRIGRQASKKVSTVFSSGNMATSYYRCYRTFA